MARRVAARLGVDLAALTGSGPRGRVLKTDVAAAARSASAVPVAGSAHAVSAARLQPAPAAALTVGSAQTAPGAAGFSLEVDVDLAAAIELRARLGTTAPTLDDFVVKACGSALRGDGAGDGIAVALAGRDGFVAPVVRDAAARSLSSIAAEIRRLAERAQAGAVTSDDVAGAALTVVSLADRGVDRVSGAVGAALLCVGAVRERPAVVDGTVAARPGCTLTLTCERDALHDAAAFLAAVRTALEAPLTLAL